MELCTIKAETLRKKFRIRIVLLNICQSEINGLADKLVYFESKIVYYKVHKFVCFYNLYIL